MNRGWKHQKRREIYGDQCALIFVHLWWGVWSKNTVRVYADYRVVDIYMKQWISHFNCTFNPANGYISRYSPPPVSWRIVFQWSGMGNTPASKQGHPQENGSWTFWHVNSWIHHPFYFSCTFYHQNAHNITIFLSDVNTWLFNIVYLFMMFT